MALVAGEPGVETFGLLLLLNLLFEGLSEFILVLDPLLVFLLLQNLLCVLDYINVLKVNVDI